MRARAYPKENRKIIAKETEATIAQTGASPNANVNAGWEIPRTTTNNITKGRQMSFNARSELIASNIGGIGRSKM